MELFTKEAFEALSLEWVRVGWSCNTITTLLGSAADPAIAGRHAGLQEVIYAVRPAVIVETGVFHGGSCCFMHPTRSHGLGRHG